MSIYACIHPLFQPSYLYPYTHIWFHPSTRLPTPSVHIPIHVFVSTCTYIYTCTHPSIHHPSFYPAIHLSITDPHMHTLLHSVRKVSVIQSVLVLIVWDELESALFSFPKNLGILCNRPSAGTDLASENFDSMWAILWLHSLLFPWLHEYRKCPLNGTNEKEEASECISELSWQPSVGPETNIAILYTFFIIRDKTHSWMIQ